MNVRFECTTLRDTDKLGKLKKDASGYYEDVPLGGFDIHNSGNAWYDWNGSKAVFDNSGDLMRRITSGKQFSEWGHPKKNPMMTREQYLERILSIYEENVCNHIRSIDIRENVVTRAEHGKPIVGVYGSIKPCGPRGDCLEEALTNPDINSCFSVRSITFDQRRGGRLIKEMRECITWDYVLEPGISIATKYDSPSLESIVRTIFDMPLEVTLLERTRENIIRDGFGMENEAPMRMVERMLDAAKSLKRQSTTSIYLPRSAKW